MEEKLGSYYTLNGAIDASGTVNWNAGTGFVPVGNGTNAFTGNFNGAGYTISQLAINLPGTSDVGLFGYAALGSNAISNLNLTVNNITGNTYVGGLVGWLNSGTVSNCSVTVNSGRTVTASNSAAVARSGPGATWPRLAHHRSQLRTHSRAVAAVRASPRG